MNRLTDRDNVGNAVCKREYANDCNGKCSECDYDYECFKKLAYYEDLEEQGRLLILPVKECEITWDDLSEDLKELVEFGLFTKEEAFERHKHGLKANRIVSKNDE